MYHRADDFSIQVRCSNWAWTHVWKNQQWHMDTRACPFPILRKLWLDCTSRPCLLAQPVRMILHPIHLHGFRGCSRPTMSSPSLRPEGHLRVDWFWDTWDSTSLDTTVPALPSTALIHLTPLLSHSCNRACKHLWTASSAYPLNLFIHTGPCPGKQRVQQALDSASQFWLNRLGTIHVSGWACSGEGADTWAGSSHELSCQHDYKQLGCVTSPKHQFWSTLRLIHAPGKFSEHGLQHVWP